MANFKTNLPIIEFIPDQSFLRHHMVNHMNLFNIGPIITIAFMKPLKYWERGTFHKINSFLAEAKQLDNVDKHMEISWLDETYLNSKAKAEFYAKCKHPLNFVCFEETFKETMVQDFYRDDAVVTLSPTGNSSSSSHFEITASRVFLQFENFTGTLEERNLMLNLKFLAETKYNFSQQDVIIYSPIYSFLEQLDELLPTFISIFVLNFECVLFVSFFFLFDLSSMMILLAVNISLLFSIVANTLMLNLTLNIVTLYHFLLLPAVVSEFLFFISYSYLFSVSAKIRKCGGNELRRPVGGERKCDDLPSVSTTNEIKSLVEEINRPETSQSSSMASPDADPPLNHQLLKVKQSKIAHNARLIQLKHSYNQCIKHSSSFVINILMFALGLMYYCNTYNFSSLYIFMMSFSFNLFLHIFFFYPILLVFFGTTWIH